MREVFFSFHYKRDIWRAYIVRNSWYYKDTREAAGFWDSSLYEKSKKYGNNAIKKMIDDGLYGTSVTCILIGAQTYYRKWINYEIEQSYKRGNGLLGIYIHNLKNQDGNSDIKGKNPFEKHFCEDGTCFAEIFKIYNWRYHKGSQIFSKWIENATRQVGR